METNDNVVKKALAAALAKSGHKDVDSFLKSKGLPTGVPLSPKEEEMLGESKKDIQKGRVTPIKNDYCDRSCQGAVHVPTPPAPEKEGPQRLTPIWPLPEGETVEQFRARLVAERAIEAKKREDFLKEIDSLEHLAKVRASAIEAAQKIPSRYVPSSAATQKREDKEEKKEAKAKAKTEKKEAGRQNRLGQTKLIDELIKEGKNEKEIFDAVRLKIPAYPADKLPKLIKLRQYHKK